LKIGITYTQENIEIKHPLKHNDFIDVIFLYHTHIVHART